ncbi:neurogenic locus notch homolog protein 1, partial [Plakobranchus ocellatus]
MDSIGWDLMGTHCYNYIDVAVDYFDAKEQCSRLGSSLIVLRDEIEAMQVSERADTIFKDSPLNKGHYWILNGESNPDACQSLWQPGQPKELENDPDDHAIASNFHGRWRVEWLWTNLPFVCRSPACPSGSFRCRDGKCINDKWRCDGVFDCEDHSDETDNFDSKRCKDLPDCYKYFRMSEGTVNTDDFDDTDSCLWIIEGQPGQILKLQNDKILTYFMTSDLPDCYKYFRMSEGTVNTNDFEDTDSCLWIIEGQPGQILKLQIAELVLTQHIDKLTVYAGGASIADSYADIRLELSESKTDVTFWGTNQFLIVALDASASNDTAVVKFSWEADVALALGVVEMLTVTDQFQSIETPYFELESPPRVFKKEWLLKAEPGQLITFEVEEFTFNLDENALDDIEIINNDGLTFLKPVENLGIWVSEGNEMRVILKNTGLENRRAKAKFRTGCDVELVATYILMELQELPPDTKCTWTMMNPLSTSFSMGARFQFDDDDDSIKIFDGLDATDDDKLIYTAEGTSLKGDLLYDLPSSITLAYSSNIVRAMNSFGAQIQADCPAPPNLENMLITADPARQAGLPYYLNLTCEEGYAFKQEEFKAMGTVRAECRQDGSWFTGSDSYTRYPECDVAYCGAPTPVDNGFIEEVFSVTYGGQAVHSCFDGFTLAGNAQITCLANGTWSAAPRCEAENCPPVPDIEYGYHEVIVGDENPPAFSTVVRYHCDPGYHLLGARQVFCNLTWSHPSPVCKKLKCSLPRIPRGSFSPEGVLPKFGKNVTLTCEDGFQVNRTKSQSTVLTCEADRMLNFVDDICVDVDECQDPNTCSSTQVCINTEGSYACKCLPGYAGPSCDDIDECQLEDRGGCDMGCDNLQGTYACTCNSGFLLYTMNGTGGLFLRPGETGLRAGDVLRLNQSCVRSLCEGMPPAPSNGSILSAKSVFEYEETVAVACDFGYKLEGSAIATCEASGNWTINATCTRLTCIQPSVSSHEAMRVPGVGVEIGPEDSLTITCIRQDGTDTAFNKTMYCAPDPDRENVFTLQGDDPVCPDVDCGPVWEIPGAENVMVAATTYGSTFEFSCDSSRGFTLQGQSSQGNTTVMCESSGRWGYNNLTCIGSRCGDPGTRAGTVQIVATSYEIDQVVLYNCTEEGYTTITPNTLTCVYNNGSATWDNVAPVCNDTTAPIIECPANTALNLYDTIEYSPPTAYDNSGYSCLLLEEGPPSGSPVLSENTTVKYAARDRYLEQTCEFQITLKDRTPPTLNCKAPFSIELGNMSTGVVNINESLVIDSTSEQSVYLSPRESVSVEIGDIIIVNATVRKENGLRSECKIMISAVSSSCLESSFPAVQNGQKTCTGDQASMTCKAICNDGFLFQDESAEVSHTCTNGVWSTEFPLQPCIQLTNPTFQYEVQLIHGISGVLLLNFDTAGCFASHETALVTLSEQISACGLTDFSATSISVQEQTINSVYSEFKLSVLTSCGGNQSELTACAAVLESQAEDLFGPTFPNTSGSDQTCHSPWTVQRTTVYPTVTPQSFVCTDVTSKQVISDDRVYCLPCGPGFYYNSQTASCTECDDGFYQDGFGASECKPCPNNVEKSHQPRSSEDHCYDLCPGGFISSSGYIEDVCSPCPVDTYSPDGPATVCTPCPNSGSTKGVSAATSETECFAPCPAGHYSMSGYIPCSPCPHHFYKEGSGPASNCTECPFDTFANITGAMSVSDCLTDAQLLCPMDFCNMEGAISAVCSVVNHRPMCTCKPGYHGDQCEQKCDVCSPNPCYNEGVCRADGWSFTCSCKVDSDCTYTANNTLRFSGDEAIAEEIPNITEQQLCEDACTDNPACLAYQFGELSGFTYCLNYKQLIFGVDQNPAGVVSSLKSCINTPLFEGDRCEVDLKNDCTDDICTEADFCMDLVGGTKCVCPTEGNFDETCKKPANLCEGNPCGNFGTCEAYGTVRYVCFCAPGYTGEDCEINILECELNPTGCLYSGQCRDDQDGYTCQCPQGFSGEHCQHRADLCLSNECHTEDGGGFCTGDYRRLTANCTCGEHYDEVSAERCESTNYCLDDPCVNGTCVPQFGGFICQCQDGFEGSLCQHDIDDCANKPCQNGAMCSDRLLGYDCLCDPGYTGLNCDTDIEDCVNACVAENTLESIDMINDCKCVCKPGFMGKNCSEDINECETTAPCLHGGNCTNVVGGYNCTCETGWTGENCQNVTDYCAAEVSCLYGSCYNLKDGTYCRCQAGATGENCEFQKDLCELYGDLLCTNNATCSVRQGLATCDCPGKTECNYKPNKFLRFSSDAKLVASADTQQKCQEACDDDVTCTAYQFGPGYCLNYETFDVTPLPNADDVLSFEKNCSTTVPYYSGKSCELEKNHCSDDSICSGGKCVLDDLGFKCNCSQTLNYEGETCMDEKEVCPPCPSDGPCQKYLDGKGFLKGACQCPGNKVLAGNACQDVDRDFDLAFLHSFAELDTGVKSERGFFLKKGSNLTISLWVAPAQKLEEDVEILAIRSSQDDVNLFTIKNKEVVFASVARPITDLDQDFRWHFLSVSWAIDGTAQIVRDFTVNPQTTVNVLPPQDEYLYVHLGKSFFGYVSQVSVWGVVFTDRDHISMLDEPQMDPQPLHLLLGWTYYTMSRQVLQTNTSTAGRLVAVCDISGTIGTPELTGCDQGMFKDKNPPILTKECNASTTIVTDYSTHQVSASRLGYMFKITQDSPAQSPQAYPEQFFTHGAHDLALFATDGEGNVGVCMTRTYVTPNQCNATKPKDSLVKSCDSNLDGREVACPLGQLPSVPTPRFLVCGELRSYNLDNMYTRPDRLVCGASLDRSFTVHVTLTYEIFLNCEVDIIDSMKARLLVLIQTLGMAWNTLCLDDGCSNAAIDGSCSNANQKAVILEVTIASLEDKLDPLPSNAYQFSLTPLQLLERTIEEKSALEMTNIASAELLVDQSIVTAEPSCAEGYSLIDENCVECGPGSFYNAGSKSCMLCPLHEYTTTARLTACIPCGNGQGTLQRGSSNMNDCVDLCQPGELYNITSGECESCPKNFFQNETGQMFCYPCRPSSGTETTGSTDASQCKDFCPGGTELRDGDCAKCRPGYFRVGFQQDACTPCPMMNMTTRGEGADSELQCNIPRCPPGQFVKEDGEERTCEPCDFGTYQALSAQFSCEPCAENYTTEDKGATNSTQCLFFCPPGQQEVPANSGECFPCGQGTYRDASLSSRFIQCQECPPGFTTEGRGMMHRENCSITSCPAGQYVNMTDNMCYDCDYGFYQPMKWQTECEKCPPQFTTVDKGSVNETECKFVCPPGREEHPPGSQQCQPCPRGSYRSGKLDMRFENCTICTGGMTTQGPGANSSSDCMIRICKAGSYRNATMNECRDCPFNTYQDEDLQDECKTCPDNEQTRKEGSKNITDCEFVCPAGQEVDESGADCGLCKRGTFKNATMTFEMCMNCTDGTTTDGPGAVSAAFCNIPACKPGFVVSDDKQKCVACPIDYYQPVDLPFSMTECLMCPNNTGTMEDARVLVSQCTDICPRGYGLTDGQCNKCRQGTWNNGNQTLRFEPCQACPENYTTEVEEGATAAENCSLRFCKAGTFRNASMNECMDCPLNTYQDEDLKDECKSCPDDKLTKTEGSKSLDDCEFVCPPGQEVDVDGTTCSPCNRGTYKNSTMTFDKCTNCTTGTTTDGPGANSSQLCNIPACSGGYVISIDTNLCVKCPRDQYQPVDLPFSMTKCLMCPNNTGTMEDARISDTQCTSVCPPGYGLTNGQCKVCSLGTWNNGNQTLRFEPCQACPEGFTTEVEEGATAVQNCSIRDCPPGSFFDAADPDACKKCAVGLYQPLPRQTSCMQCPNDTSTFDEGSTNLTACTIKCPAGEEDDGTETCTSCPDDKFKPEASFGECQPCTGDLTSSQSNRTACTIRLCDVGREGKNDTCSDCLEGFYKSQRGNMECTSCPGNTTTSSRAATSMSECTVVSCEAGLYSKDNMTCLPCPVGTYKTGRGNQECTPCAENVTTESVASKMESDCYLKLCKVGQYRDSTNICQDCSPGFFQNETGQTTCIQCPVGYTSLQARSTEASSCRIICSPGYYRNDTTNQCMGCRQGSYQPASGATSCLSCEGNFTTAGEGSASAAACYVTCPLGYFRSGPRFCSACAVGEYQDVADLTSCKSCGTIDGFEASTFRSASVAETYCFPKCDQGLYLNMTERKCNSCPIGQFKDAVSLATLCNPCPPGLTTNQEGATSPSDCSFSICPSGFFRAANEEDCTQCDYGYYQPLSNSIIVTSCRPCPGGGTTLNKGTALQDLCVPSCPGGSAYNVASENCVECPIGQYRPAGINPPWCRLCPSGTTTTSRGSDSCIATPVTQAPLVRTSISVIIVMNVGSCDNREHIRQTIVDLILMLIQSQQRRYPGLCPAAECGNINILFISFCGDDNPGRKKRQTDTTATIEVVAQNVNPVLASADDAALQRDTQDILQNAFYDTGPVAQALIDNGLAISSVESPPTCAAGQRINGQSCEACGKGTYSTSPVSEICSTCPDGKTTTGNGTTSSLGCVSPCRADSAYCGTRGTCTLRAGTTDVYYCLCTEKYTGTACQQRLDDSDDDNLILVVVVCSCVGGILLLLLVIIGYIAW